MIEFSSKWMSAPCDNIEDYTMNEYLSVVVDSFIRFTSE
jgi:hypothetical protein